MGGGQVDGMILTRPPDAARAHLAWSAVAAWTALIYTTGQFNYAVFWWSALVRPKWYSIGTAACLLVAAGYLARRLWARRAFTGRAGLARLAAWLLLVALGAWAFSHAHGAAARIHFILYGVLSCLVLFALRRHWTDWSVHPLAALVVFTLGVGDEMLQGVLPRRIGDVEDLWINVAASLLALGGLLLLRRERLPWDASGAPRLAAGFSIAALALCGFLSLNPDRPFGYRHETEAGVFFSVFTLEELHEEDTRAAALHRDELARWSSDFENDMRALAERRFTTLGLSERGADVLLAVFEHVIFRNRRLDAGDPEAGWRETLAGDAAFAGLVGDTPLAWDEKVRSLLSVVVPDGPPPPPWISEYVPGVSPHYTITDAGGRWRVQSRAPEAALRATLAARAGDYRRAMQGFFESGWKRFYSDYPTRDRFLWELRAHLFRRYHGAMVGDYRVALGEERILERWYGESLAATGLGWSAAARDRLAARLPRPATAYESLVGKDYHDRWRLWQVWTAAGACVGVAWLAAWGMNRRRASEQAAKLLEPLN
ncbi:VanZ family protein [bacterium]|nr:VanZ family protein [bacterium]